MIRLKGSLQLLDTLLEFAFIIVLRVHHFAMLCDLLLLVLNLECHFLDFSELHLLLVLILVQLTE